MLKYDQLMKPTIEVLDRLGGSGSIQEINDALVQALNIPETELEATYPTSGAPILADRMSWARSYLKTGGFLDSERRGVWVLTDEGRAALSSAEDDIKRKVKSAVKAETLARNAERTASDQLPEQIDWNDKLLVELQKMEPAAFERLCQRLLRESGFTKVEVTGKSGDGGIDGVGVLRVQLVSFHVLFQCKRWKGSVGSEAVRNFRGAMQGRADKGLIITTGSFTTEARKEATRDGAPAIDLIDGESLSGLLKDLQLGVIVKTRIVEDVQVDSTFFQSV